MKKITYITLALGLVLASGVSTKINTAQALSCAPSTLEGAIEKTPVIFAGKVISYVPETPQVAAHNVFEVTQYWKGDLGKKVITGNTYGWTGTLEKPPFFKIGETYLVYAAPFASSTEKTRGIPNHLFAGIDCSKTKLLSYATADLALLGPGKIPTEPGVWFFPRNLTVGSSGQDVIDLQTFLESKGFLVMPQGVAKGYFGGLTRAALVKYQQSVGIRPAAGYFGPATRQHVQTQNR